MKYASSVNQTLTLLRSMQQTKQSKNIHSHISSATNENWFGLWYGWWKWLLILYIFVDCIEVSHRWNDRLKAQSSANQVVLEFYVFWCYFVSILCLSVSVAVASNSWSTCFVVAIIRFEKRDESKNADRLLSLSFAMRTQWKALLFVFFFFSSTIFSSC